MSGGELKVLLALDKLAEYINSNSNAGYTSICGTFYQNTADNSIEINELSNNTTQYSLSIVGESAGQATFLVEGADSDIRRILIFLGPPAHNRCIFTIQNDSDSPAVIVVNSTNLETNAPDPRGFGSNGQSPISFEIRFY
jgi:hypothetical protein